MTSAADLRPGMWVHNTLGGRWFRVVAAPDVYASGTVRVVTSNGTEFFLPSDLFEQSSTPRCHWCGRRMPDEPVGRDGWWCNDACREADRSDFEASRDEP